MQGKLETEIGRVALVVGFFTRLPLPDFIALKIQPEDTLGDGANYFPAAGFVIGLAGGLVLYVFSSVLPVFLAAGLALAVVAILTGALHEDGLADCADGFGATSDRQRALEIMSDSRIGTYGTIVLVIVIGLKWASLASLTPAGAFAALIVCHTVSRAAILIAMAFSRYAKPEGLGKMVDGPLPTQAIGVTLVVATVVSLIFAGLWGIVALVFAYLAAAVFLAYLNHRLGGYTGDGLGGMQQLAEVAAMMTLAGAWA